MSENINIVNDPIPQDSETPITTYTTWDELEIDEDLLRGIYAYGFEKPSPIQGKAIAPIKLEKDVIAQAQSGTGKTAAFTIGALSRISVKDRYTQALIMVPTHELAQQITSVISSLSSMMKGVVIKTIIGGSSIDEDVADMRTNPPHIIVGCPGRIYDMIRRRHINANKLKIIILDNYEGGLGDFE